MMGIKNDGIVMTVMMRVSNGDENSRKGHSICLPSLGCSFGNNHRGIAVVVRWSKVHTIANRSQWPILVGYILGLVAGTSMQVPRLILS